MHKDSEFRVYCGGITIYSDSKGWAEIIKPNYVNSLGECFYYGDDISYIDKETLKIYNRTMSEGYSYKDSKMITEIMTKESAEKWIEDNKPENILADFCKKISQQEDCPTEFVDIVNKEFWNLI